MSSAADLASGAEAPYWQGLLDGVLRLQRCGGCGAWHWPAVWRCSGCGSWDHVWEDVPMRGEIYTWTRTWHGFGGLEDVPKPFVVVVVTLDGGGGARLMGILEGDTQGIAIGQRVHGHVGATVHNKRAVPALRWTRA